MPALSGLPLFAASAPEICGYLDVVVTSFMSTLSADEEIGVVLASFGVSHEIAVVNFRALGSQLLLVEGYEAGRFVVLAQHVSQLSFLLVALKKSSPDQPARRKIGFLVDPPETA